MPQRRRLATENPVAYCDRVYPIENSGKVLANLKTVGLKLNPNQAAHLSKLLALASKEWNHIELTVYRKITKKEDAYRITVTTASR